MEKKVDLHTAIKQNLFRNQFLIHKNGDVMDCEKIGPDAYLFDTTARIGVCAEISINDIPHLISHETAIRITLASNQKGLSDIKLDEEFFESIDAEEVHWTIYKKADSQSPSYDTVIVGNDEWTETDITPETLGTPDDFLPLTELLAKLDSETVGSAVFKHGLTIYKNLSEQNFGQLCA